MPGWNNKPPPLPGSPKYKHWFPPAPDRRSRNIFESNQACLKTLVLRQQNCRRSLPHSRTRDLASVIHRADIVIAAVGRPEMIKGDWIRPDAVVIDVGINRVIDKEEGKTSLVGDVAMSEALSHVRAITPVPGGVGPMTIAVLLRNTLVAACQRKGLPAPEGL